MSWKLIAGVPRWRRWCWKDKKIRQRGRKLFRKQLPNWCVNFRLKNLNRLRESCSSLTNEKSPSDFIRKAFNCSERETWTPDLMIMNHNYIVFPVFPLWLNTTEYEHDREVWLLIIFVGLLVIYYICVFTCVFSNIFEYTDNSKPCKQQQVFLYRRHQRKEQLMTYAPSSSGWPTTCLLYTSDAADDQWRV